MDSAQSQAPVTPAQDTTAPAAPAREATPGERLETSRERVLSTLAKQNGTAPPPTADPAKPSQEEERTERLARAVAADNRARAEMRRATAEREALAADRVALEAERTAGRAAAAELEEMRQLASEGRQRAAMDRLLGAKLSDEQFLTLVQQYAADEETPEQLVERKLAERDKAHAARVAAAAAAEAAERERVANDDKAHLTTASTAYWDATVKAWDPAKYPHLEALVNVDHDAVHNRFVHFLKSHPDREDPPSVEELLTEWETEKAAVVSRISARSGGQATPPARPALSLPSTQMGSYSVGKVIDTRTPGERLAERREALEAKLRAMDGR